MRRALLTQTFEKAMPPGSPSVGDSYMGGYYAGIIDTTDGNIIAGDYFQTGARYALIVAGKSLESSKVFTTAGTSPSQTLTRWNGLDSTVSMNSAPYPAAQYCYGLTAPTDAASPWYLPALDELELAWRVFKPITDANYTTPDTGSAFPGGTVAIGYNPSSNPAGAAYTSSVPPQTSIAVFKTGGAEAMSGIDYYSATAYSAEGYRPWRQVFSAGSPGMQSGDTGTKTVRPVRRLVL